MSSAKKAQGTKVYLGTSSTTYPKTGGTAIAEVQSITLPNQQVAAIDATSHDSTAAEVIAGLPDNGEVSMEMLYVGSAGQAALRTNVGNTQHFYINLAGGTNQPQIEFIALNQSWNWGSASGTGNEALKATATLRISGAVTVSTTQA